MEGVEREGEYYFNCIRVAELVQEAFLRGEAPETMEWYVMVIILNSEGNTMGIGLMEVLCNFIATIINVRIKKYITLHGPLCGF